MTDPLTTRFFCRNQQDEVTGLYEDAAKAIGEAEERKLAPFTVFEYLAHPVMHRVTNGRIKLPSDIRVDHWTHGKPDDQSR